MVERYNTVVYSFDLASPRITANDIHEWIFAVLRIPEHSVQMIQIDGINRHVYIKLADADSVYALLRDTAGQAEYKYPTGDMSIVHIALAGNGTKRIRVANLPSEASNDTLKAALAPYGKIMDIQNERWSKVYRYRLSAGNDGFITTRPVPLDCCRPAGPPVIRWAAAHLLWLWRVGTHVPEVPSTPQNDNKDLHDGCHVCFYCYGEHSNGRKLLE